MTNYFTQEKNKINLKNFYEKEFKWSHSTIYYYDEFASQRKVKIILEEIKKQKVSGRILDVGCGGGLLDRIIAQKLKTNVIGCDISQSLLKKLPDNKNVKLVSADAFKLPLKDNSFKYVLCSEVLEHFENPQIVLKEIYRVLKNKGKVFITIPNLYCYDSLEAKTKIISKTLNIYNVLRKLWGFNLLFPFGVNTHLIKLTSAGWKKLFSKQKFKVIKQKPIFISLYIPQYFSALKNLEELIYKNKNIFNLQEKIEKSLSKIYPFKYLGQLHFFVLEKD